MQVSKVEKILKRKVGPENKKRAERVKQGYDAKGSYARPIKFTEVLSLNWQVRNKIFKGYNNKCTFDPVTMQAYSYKHWRFVDVIKGKVVFNNYGYSNTTSGHQWAVKSLLNSLGIKIDLEIEMHSSLSCFKNEALPALYEKLADFEVIVNRKGSRDETKKRYNDAILEVKSKIAKARLLGAKCSKDSIAAIYASAKDTESKRLAKLASERVSRSNESKASRQLEQTGQVIDLNQFAT